jgi:hypothetical protein
VIIVDDAHKIYHDEYFWTILFKSLVPTPKKFIFVFACSYLRTIGSMENPLILTPCRSRNNVHDFLLSKEESHQLILDDRIGLQGELKNDPLLHGVIERNSNGHIGCLRMSIDELNRTNKHAPLQTETDAIVSQLSQSLPNSTKYFGISTWTKDGRS